MASPCAQAQFRLWPQARLALDQVRFIPGLQRETLDEAQLKALVGRWEQDGSPLTHVKAAAPVRLNLEHPSSTGSNDMNTTWTLIANAAHARLLQQEEARQLHVLQTLEHPPSRVSSSKLGDDKAGRELSGRGFGGAAYEPRLDAHRKEHQRFAQQLAQLLEEGAEEQRYDVLHVFASSPFLGELKHVLGPAARRMLAGTHDVDLTAVGLAELPARIRQEMN